MKSKLSLSSECVETKPCKPCTSFTSHLHSSCGMVWYRTLRFNMLWMHYLLPSFIQYWLSVKLKLSKLHKFQALSSHCQKCSQLAKVPPWPSLAAGPAIRDWWFRTILVVSPVFKINSCSKSSSSFLVLYIYSIPLFNHDDRLSIQVSIKGMLICCECIICFHLLFNTDFRKVKTQQTAQISSTIQPLPEMFSAGKHAPPWPSLAAGPVIRDWWFRTILVVSPVFKINSCSKSSSSFLVLYIYSIPLFNHDDRLSIHVSVKGTLICWERSKYFHLLFNTDFR